MSEEERASTIKVSRSMYSSFGSGYDISGIISKTIFDSTRRITFRSTLPPINILRGTMKEQGSATQTEQKERQMDLFWMNHALALAKEASRKGEVPVGAIVVHKNAIIGAAHNLRESLQDPTAHAEVLAIKQAAEYLGSWRLEKCTLYVTLEPCPMCSGAMWLSRIERCVYGCSDPKTGFLGSLSNLMDFEKLNHHYEVYSGVLEQECSEVLRSFFRQIRESKSAKKAKETSKS